MKYGKFATAVNCMDGRVQEPVIKYLKKKYGVKYVDMITGPGILKKFSKPGAAALREIKNSVNVSVKKHGSKVIIIAGHPGCAGNPVEKKQQEKQLKKAVEKVNSWKTGVSIIKGLWAGNKIEEIL